MRVKGLITDKGMIKLTS